MNQSAEKFHTLLLVDDDLTFCHVLRQALVKRGFAVTVAHSVEQALPLVKNSFQYAIVDLKMGGASGLVLVQALHEFKSSTKIVMLTGFASVATTVDAIKLGATQYLAKPANADQIVAAFNHSASAELNIESNVVTLERLEADHIQKILHEQQHNITATARALSMHRRTLQRKLNKMQSNNLWVVATNSA